jgi:hypothetical protein
MGWLYNNENPIELENIILNLIENPDQIKSRSLNTKRIFEERFTERKVYSKMSEFLENLKNDSLKIEHSS